MKLGRPRKSVIEPIMASINFKADIETLAALAQLESDHANVRGRRSTVLRKLILDAARARKQTSNQNK